MTIKGPTDKSTAGLAKVLQLRAEPKIEKVEEKKEAVASSAPPPAPSDATFEGTTGSQQIIAAPVDGAGGSQLLARLKARGLEGKAKVAKTAANSGPQIVQTAEGKVFSGSVSIESKSGLSKLTDVVRVGGGLNVHEAQLKNTDLLALKSLKTVEGRLTFEGLRSAT